MALEPNDRSRRKLAAQAEKLLEPGAAVRGVFVGKAHARLTQPVAVTLGVFGGAFLVALAYGVILIPGVLLILLVLNSMRPPRVVLLADQGVAVLSRSQLTGRPAKVVAKLPWQVLPPPAALTSGARAVVLGPDRISFSKRERARLALSSAGHPARAAG